jgi:CTP synthase
LRALYGYVDEVEERHRHRYEVNPDYVDRLEAAGLDFIGKDDTGKRMEIVELKDHPWYVGVQFHPEYQSKVLDPSRPYLGFFAASAGCLDRITKELSEKVKGTDGLTNGVGKEVHF